MPVATVITETTVTPSAGSSQTLLVAPGASNRFWIEIVNSNTTHRLFITTSSPATSACKSADPNNGVWEGPVGPGIALYCLWEDGATAAPVRIIQYSTS